MGVEYTERWLQQRMESLWIDVNALQNAVDAGEMWECAVAASDIASNARALWRLFVKEDVLEEVFGWVVPNKHQRRWRRGSA